MMSVQKIGVKALRERAGLKKAELSRRAGLSTSSINRLETGKTVSRVLAQRALNALNAELGMKYTLEDIDANLA